MNFKDEMDSNFSHLSMITSMRIKIIIRIDIRISSLLYCFDVDALDNGKV